MNEAKRNEESDLTELLCVDDERIYPCNDCGLLRSKNEGGTVLTVWEDCWDKHFKKKGA